MTIKTNQIIRKNSSEEEFSKLEKELQEREKKGKAIIDVFSSLTGEIGLAFSQL